MEDRIILIGDDDLRVFIETAYESFDGLIEENVRRLMTIMHEITHMILRMVRPDDSRKKLRRMRLSFYADHPVSSDQHYMDTYSTKVLFTMLRAIMTPRLQIGVDAEGSKADNAKEPVVCF